MIVSENIIGIKYDSFLNEDNKCITCDFGIIYINNIEIKYKNGDFLSIKSEVDNNDYLVTESNLINWLFNNLSLDELLVEINELANLRLKKRFSSSISVKFNDNMLLNLITCKGLSDFISYNKIDVEELFSIVKPLDKKIDITFLHNINQENFNYLIEILINNKVKSDLLFRIALSYNEKNFNLSAIEDYFIKNNDVNNLLELYYIFRVKSIYIMNRIKGENIELLTLIVNNEFTKKIIYNSHLEQLKSIIEEHCKKN